MSSATFFWCHRSCTVQSPEQGLTLQQLFAGRGIDIRAGQTEMKRLMAKEGLPYGERMMTYNSRLAQELAIWAETQPGGDAIHNALFRAYFVDGTNIIGTSRFTRTRQNKA